MKDETRQLLEKASRAVSAAEGLIQQGHADFAAGRAYYAMFYAAEALLAEKGLHSRKHGGVHAAFGKHFAETGLLDAKFHRWLLDAFDKRLQGDYGFDAIITPEDAAAMIAQASEFLRAALEILENTS